MNISTHCLVKDPDYAISTTITTTLYDLIETISEEVKEGEETLIEKTVLHLFDSGQARFIGSIKNLIMKDC